MMKHLRRLSARLDWKEWWTGLRVEQETRFHPVDGSQASLGYWASSWKVTYQFLPALVVTYRTQPLIISALTRQYRVRPTI